jgi:hypothetical protein
MPAKFRRFCLAILLLTATPVLAEDLTTLQADLRRHSQIAKEEGGAGQKALAAGNTEAGCAHLRKSEEEIIKVRDLLAKLREAVGLDAGSVTDAVLRVQKIDEMDGAWIHTHGQIRDLIAKRCSA